MLVVHVSSSSPGRFQSVVISPSNSRQSRGCMPLGNTEVLSAVFAMVGTCTTWKVKGVRAEVSCFTNMGKFPRRLVGKAVTLNDLDSTNRRPLGERIPNMSDRLDHVKYSARCKSGTTRRQRPRSITCHPKKSYPKARAFMTPARKHVRVICMRSICCIQNQYPKAIAGPNVMERRNTNLPVLVSGTSGRLANIFPSYLNSWDSSSFLSISNCNLH